MSSVNSSVYTPFQQILIKEYGVMNKHLRHFYNIYTKSNRSVDDFTARLEAFHTKIRELIQLRVEPTPEEQKELMHLLRFRISAMEADLKELSFGGEQGVVGEILEWVGEDDLSIQQERDSDKALILIKEVLPVSNFDNAQYGSFNADRNALKFQMIVRNMKKRAEERFAPSESKGE